jgi:CHRD domain
MRRWVIGTTAAVAAAALGATTLIGSAGGSGARSSALSDRALFATLTGAAERPAADRDGKGAASIFITGSRVCFGIQVNGIDRPTMAHIHRGGSRVNGPIVVALRPPSTGGNGASSGCVTTSTTNRNDIKRSPAGFYVNVHTRAFPNGAVRGQLKP